MQLKEFAKRYLEYRVKNIGLKRDLGGCALADDFIGVLEYYSMKWLSESGTIANGPMLAHWALTTRCNARCKHCYLDENTMPAGEVSADDAVFIVDQMKTANVIQAILSGGEPFLRKDLIDIVAHLKEHRLIVEILTNASLITENKANDLAKILDPRVDHVQVSLDGPTARIHDAQRGVKIFDKTIEAIKRLQAGGINPLLRFSPTYINYRYLIDTYLLANKLKVAAFAASDLCYVGRAKNLQRVPVNELFRVAVETLKLSMEKGFNTPYVDALLGMMFNFEEFRELIPQRRGNARETRSCPAAISRCAIDAVGDVYPCSIFSPKHLCAGNILEESLLDIWTRGRNWQTFREGRRFNETKCENCGYLYWCKGGCPMTAMAEHGTTNAPDPGCIYEPDKDIVKEGKDEKHESQN
jgi:radical SAM protein with 4Fe4S-binding SPASM domain